MAVTPNSPILATPHLMASSAIAPGGEKMDGVRPTLGGGASEVHRYLDSCRLESRSEICSEIDIEGLELDGHRCCARDPS